MKEIIGGLPGRIEVGSRRDGGQVDSDGAGSKRGRAKALDALLTEAVASQAAPFVVGITANAAGSTWCGACGDQAFGIAATQDTVFRIFSMSKGICATAVAILVDRGQLDLDTAVEDILPDFAKLGILADGAEGRLELLAPAGKATVRHLATHTSGLGYEFWDAATMQYLKDTGQPSVLTGTLAGLRYPLLFEPGTRWQYGIGVDWLGLLIEAIDGRRVDRFCQEEIFDPLGMVSTGFEPSARAEMAGAFARLPGGFAQTHLAPPTHPDVYGMGSAIYSTAPDYIRFLRMLLGQGELDGTRILSSEMVGEMLSNQIGDLRVQSLPSTSPELCGDLDVLSGFAKSHSLGFVRLEEDIPGRRAAGSQFWGGVLNTHFWFDPASDVAAVLMTQSLPFLDPAFIDIYERFERAVYENS